MSSLGGQPVVRDASSAEMDLIRDYFGVDRIDQQVSPYRVLDVSGWHRNWTDSSRPGRLYGVVRLHPYFLTWGLCVLQAHSISGVVSEDSISWYEPASVEYDYWMSDGRDSCNLDQRSRVPSGAVHVADRIPTAALARIIYGADELLMLAREHPDAESVDETHEFRDDRALQLLEVSMSRISRPELGITFSARFGSPGRSTGPSVSFSITQEGFVIHGVGYWIA